LWAERPAYDAGACTAAGYWGAVAAAVGIQQLSETEGSEVQEADNRYFLRLDPAARALIHDLARNEVPMVLLSNASQAFGEVGRRGLGGPEVGELQEGDNRCGVRLGPAARALIRELARNEVPMVLLSNASQAFGGAVRRADWFEAFGFALISAVEELVKPDRRIYEILLEALSHETGGVSIPSAVIFFD